jgi:hypothetical protein
MRGILQADSKHNYSVTTIMKRHLFLLASVMVGIVAATADAQPGKPPGPGFDGAMTKLFGDNDTFSATMDFHITQPSGKEMMMPGKIANMGDKSRFDMDMSNMQGVDIPPQAAAQMKQMGMSRMSAISRRDKKLSYIIYPDMKAYVEMPAQDTSAAPSDYKEVATKLGEETVDGHVCVKNKVVVTGPDGVAHESIVWNASDLKQFPVKIQTQDEKGMNVVMLFKDVKLEKPDSAQFEPPADCTKYKDMMGLMMSRARGAPPQ